MNIRVLSALRSRQSCCVPQDSKSHGAHGPARSQQPQAQPHTAWARLTTFGVTTLMGLSGLTWFTTETFNPQSAQAAPVASVGRAVAFTCNDSEATIKAKGGPGVIFGNSSIYVGYQQVSSLNKNPRMIRFDNGVRTWCKTDYEVTNDDGSGYGLIWDGGSVLYGVFSSTGTQGTSSQDFRRFATNGWLKTYGAGGGAKISILARINPSNGTVAYASFLSALKSDGTSNSLTVRGLTWTGSTLVVNSSSYFSPRRRDRSRMTCTGSSPFNYTVEFSANLSSVSQAVATGCQ